MAKVAGIATKLHLCFQLRDFGYLTLQIAQLQSINTDSGTPPQMQTTIDTINSTAAGELSEEQKSALAFMWNEEKLAKDIYLALYKLYPNQTLYNIPTKSEATHQNMVQELLKKYDLNIFADDFSGGYDANALASVAEGEFIIEDIKTLYDNLYSIGKNSEIDALKVGCMVEVTDINDLNERLEIANGNDDMTSVFTNLRDGSYNHYWAFDSALKTLGVSEGCCAAGDEYCKTADEYPNEHGSSSGGGYGHGRH